MAVYRLTVDGKASNKLVKAKTKAQAIAGIVEAEALSADEVAEAVSAGATISSPGDPVPAEPKAIEVPKSDPK